MTEPALHTPAPGSRIAAAGNAAAQAEPDVQAVAARQAQAAGAAPSMVPVPVSGMVRAATSDEAVYRTLVLQAGAFRQLVPQDPDRYLFYVLAIDQPVILCATKDLASSPDNQVTGQPYPTGFYLPVSLPFCFRSKGLVWAVNTSSTATARVSVAVERYEAS